MKLSKLLILLFVSLLFVGNLSAQDHQIGRAPKSAIDNQKTNTVVPTTDNASAFNSRYFAANLVGDQVVKGFLNTPSVVTNITATTRNLYAGAFANGKWYAIDFQAQTTSILGTIDTTTGVFTSVGTITGMAAANTVTGMSYDKTTSTMYVVSLNSTATLTTVYTINLTTAAMTTVTTSASGPIDISFNNAGVLYACDLVTDNLLTINKTTGVTSVIGPLGVNLNYAQGMCFDPQTDSLFLAGYTTAGNMYRLNTTTGAATLIGAMPLSTELDAFIIPGASTPPPVGNDSVLVIMNDSLVASGLDKRKADRDTLRKYMPMLASKVRYFTKDIGTTLPSLTNYSTIIIQETSYDGTTGNLIMSATQRQAIKDWLAGATPTSKRSLVNIGGDFGYAYDRTGSAALDTVFSRTYGGYQYLSDNAGASPFNSVYQISPATGTDNLNTAAPGGYYPDGCRPVSGGVAYSRYTGRGAADSLAGITKSSAAGWYVLTINQDPRYYTGTGTTPSPNQGFKRVLSQALGWVKSNGTIITSVTSVSEIANSYKLSQNYPNPFNPATKINFSIPKSGLTTLKVYDILGKEVATLVNQTMTAGSYVVDFDASQLSSGAYFYRLEVNGFVDTKRMMLIK